MSSKSVLGCSRGSCRRPFPPRSLLPGAAGGPHRRHPRDKVLSVPRWALLSLSLVVLGLPAAAPAGQPELRWESSLRKLAPRHEISATALKLPPARISAAGGERESFQLAVWPDGPGTRVELAPGALRGSRMELAAESLQVSLVHYLRTRRADYEVDHVGWWPDPLGPEGWGRAGDAEGEGPLIFWITVSVPRGFPAGGYAGEILITPEGGTGVAFPLELEVYPFDIPVRPALRTAFNLFENRIEEWYGEPLAENKSWRWDLYDLLFAHRLNPTSLYERRESRPRPEDLAPARERGLNAFCVRHVGKYLFDRRYPDRYRGEAGSEGFRDFLAELTREMSGMGEDERPPEAFLYLCDEPGPRHYAAMIQVCGALREVLPGLKIMTTRAPVDELRGLIDIWTIPLAELDGGGLKDGREDGTQVWTYVAARPHHPFPNLLLDYPALDHRMLFWIVWQLDLDGFLYFSLNLWENLAGDLPSGAPWPEGIPELGWDPSTPRGSNGSGVLLYPGPRNTVLSSVRLEVVRDGIEDLDYLQLLAEEVRRREGGGEVSPELLRQAKDLLALPPWLVESPTSYTRIPQDIEYYREGVARALVALRGRDGHEP